MPAPAAITALAEHWQTALPHLGPGDLRLLRESLAAFDAAPRDERAAREAMAALLVMFAKRFPRGHPVRDAMSRRTRLSGGAVTDWPAAAAALRTIPDLSLATPRQSPPPVQAEADEWLLAAPSLTEHQVRDNGCDPGRADLIRLPAPGRRMVLPAFQFGGDGQPIPVVLAVNRLLDAQDDPWGVADWWLGANAWLRAVPAQALGRVDDSLLLDAARAELAGE